MTRRNRKGKSYVVRAALIFLAGGFGVLSVCMGVMGYSEASDVRAREAFLSRLPDLRSAPPGETGILEGRIAASVPPLREEFVAYLREEYRSVSARTSNWVSLGGKIQPLTIETGTGAVQVINTDYTFDRAIHEWTHASRQESAPTFATGAIRISGLVAGGTVMIVGHSAPSGAPGQIIAESVAAVDRKTYLERLLRNQAAGESLSFWMILLGPIGIAYAVWDGRRVCRD